VRDAKHDSLRDDLERLRREFEDGDPMALNEAFLHYGDQYRWIRDGIYLRLREEFERSKRGRDCERDFLRWFTYTWLRIKDVPPDDAKSLGGAICHCEPDTLYGTYKNFKKKHKFPRGIQPEMQGGEDVTPSDVPGGCDSSLLYERISKWYMDQGHPRKKAEDLASKLLTPSFSNR
jgi:hypothetical protein